MKLPFLTQSLIPACRRAGWALALLVAGCGGDDVQVYKVAKDSPQTDSAAQAPVLPPNHPDTSGAAPRLQWKLPQGWQEVPPGQMRAASFKLMDKDAKQADVSVVPLPGLAGGDLANVNRWREQVSLPSVQEEDLPKLAQAVEIAGQTAQLYDLAGTNAGSGEKTRILAAVLKREGSAWFFKMTGEDALVAQQKPAFVEFLKSVSFPTTAAQAQLPASHPPVDGSGLLSQPTDTTPSVEGKPSWQVPSGWHEAPAGQFLVAKYTVAGDGADQAAVNVSMSPGEGGGVLANVNRWRGQLGLNPLTRSDLDKQMQTLDMPEGKTLVIEMAGTDRTGQKSQLIGAIVPRNGQTWFYKLMGAQPVVQRQKQAFTNFVQTAKY
jgi:hypothetical protein